MAAPQQIFIATPGNIQGATIISAPFAQANIANQQSSLTDQEKDNLRFFTRLKTGLYAIGSVSIVLGCGVLAAGIVALALGSYLELGFTFAWAGFAFAIINGSVAIKGAKMQPHIDNHWCRVLLGIGSTALVLHFIDFIIASVSAGLYDVEYTKQVPCNGGYCYSYYYYMVTPTSSEAPRIVMLITLIAMDICQLVAVSKCMNKYVNHAPANTQPLYASPQAFTVIQTNNTVPGTSYVVMPSAQMNAQQPPMHYQPQMMPQPQMIPQQQMMPQQQMPMMQAQMPMQQPQVMPPQNKHAEAYEPPPYYPTA